MIDLDTPKIVTGDEKKFQRKAGMSMRNLLLLAIFLFVISTIASAGYFTSTVNSLISLTEKCIENDVFHEELFSVETGLTWADVVFLPSVALKMVEAKLAGDELLGFFVFKIHKDILEEPTILIKINTITFGGVTAHGNVASSIYPAMYLLTDSYLAKLTPVYTDITTDMDFVIIVLYQSVDWAKPVMLNLTTATSQALWRIKPNSKDLIKLKELVSE